MIKDLVDGQDPLTVLDAMIAGMRRRLRVLEDAREVYAGMVGGEGRGGGAALLAPPAAAPSPPPSANGEAVHGAAATAYTPDRHRVLLLLRQRGAQTVNDVLREVRCEPSVVKGLIGPGHVADHGGYLELTARGAATLADYDARVPGGPGARAARTPDWAAPRRGDARGKRPLAVLGVLALLSDGAEMTRREMAAKARCSPATLDNCTRQGLIEMREKDGVAGPVHFAITAAGRAKLAEWADAGDAR